MSNFIPRTTAPTEANSEYFSDNVFHIYGFGMPNCTAYAWGRFYEILGSRPTLSTGDAEKWYPYTQDGYARGATPKLGAIVCWSRGVVGNDDDGSGHVAIVEDILTDGTIVTSNSAYGGNFFYMNNVAPPYTMGSYTFQGFIYNPKTFTRKLPLWMLFKFSDWRLKHC